MLYTGENPGSLYPITFSIFGNILQWFLTLSSPSQLSGGSVIKSYDQSQGLLDTQLAIEL